MVAIFSGNGLGLNLTSLSSLGGRGILGSATQGRNGERAYVNAATGNLVVQDVDAGLVGVGPDATSIRTYNSQGGYDFDGNADGWQGTATKGIRVVSSTQLQRLDYDGSVCEYTSADNVHFTAAVAAGSARDTIEKKADGTFTWTDGATGLTETYQAAPVGGVGLISTAADTSGNTENYFYNAQNARLLDRVETCFVDANGTRRAERVQYTYQGGNLAAVDTYVLDPANPTAAPVRLSQVTYRYESVVVSGSTRSRLRSLSVTLSPDSRDPVRAADEANRTTYTTTYGYDAAGNLSSITQDDQTSLQFTHELVNGAYRVTRVQDGAGQVTRLAYDTAGHLTTVTDPLNVTTRLVHDAGTGQLTQVQAGITSGRPSGLSTVQYEYDGLQGVRRITDGLGNAVAFTYDGSGNVTSQVDGAGNRIDRTYNALNQLLSETKYTVANPNATDLQTRALTTRYVYDGENRNLLRFEISPEGRVTEHVYTPRGGVRPGGLLLRTIVYTGATYGTAGTPSESDLSAWADGVRSAWTGAAQVELTEYDYDNRGQLKSETTWGTVDPDSTVRVRGRTGTGSTTQYAYDQRGLLLKEIGPATSTGQAVTDSHYDGLGRRWSTLTSVLNGDPANPIAPIQTYDLYDDVSRKTTVELANGLLTTSTYDLAGRLISVVESTRANPAVALGTTRYAYDADGRLLMTQDPTGLRSWILYDAAGRKVAEVASITGGLAGTGQGNLTEYRYDEAGRLVQTISYHDAVSTSGLVDASGNPTTGAIGADGMPSALATLRPTTNAEKNARSWNLYDRAGRLTYQVDAAGYVTQTVYDGASRVLSVTKLAAPIDTRALESGQSSIGLGSFTTTVQLTNTASGTGPNAPRVLKATVTSSRSAGVTGTVTFFAGTACLGAASVSGGVASLTVTTLPVGTATLTAVYSGDGSNLGSVSNAVAETVTALTATTTTLRASRSQVSEGSPVTLTAWVQGTGPTGTVTFRQGATVLGTAALVDGLASLVVTSFPVGGERLTAEYAGDASNAASASEVVAPTVLTNAGVTLEVSAASSTYGGPVTLKATVTGASPTGTVSFFRGTTLVGIARVRPPSWYEDANAVLSLADLPVTDPALGVPTFSAVYSGDGQNAVAMSTQSVTHTVQPAPTTTVLLASSAVASPQAQWTLTAVVAGGRGATGTVTFMSGATTLGTASVVNGRAVLVTTAAVPSASSFSASYAGDANHLASTSSGLGYPTQTFLTASSASISAGAPLTVTARVMGAGKPTGTVVFSSNGVRIGTAALLDGVATLTIDSLVTVGTESLTASYLGDPWNTGSASAAFSETIVLPVPRIALSTSGSATQLKLTATLVGSGAVPTGQVTFFSGKNVLGTTDLASGAATITVSNLAAGAEPIHVAYAGDGNYGSTSIVQTEGPVPAAVTLTASTLADGRTLLTGKVTGQGVPTGDVTFLDGTVELATLSLASQEKNGIVTFVPNRPLVGRSLLARYSGDAINGAAESPAHFIATRTATALTFEPATARQGDPVKLTATVTGPSAAGGVVTFVDGQNALGTAQIVDGRAVLEGVRFSTAGSHSLQATYSGDVQNSSSVSAAAAFTVTALPGYSPPAAATRLPSKCTLSLSATNVGAGAPLTMTALVEPGVNEDDTITRRTITGTVLFYRGATLIGSGAVEFGKASLTPTDLPVGTYDAATNPLTAVYSGDGQSAAAVSKAPESALTIAAQGPTKTTLTASTTTTTVGSQVVLVAQVSGVSPDGYVTFKNGNTVIGMVRVLDGATAPFWLSSLPVGTASITAEYGGDPANAASSSSAVSIAVAAAKTASTVTWASPPPTKVAPGAYATFDVAVTPGATGTVSFFYEDAYQPQLGGVASTLLGTAQVNASSGRASLTVGALPSGWKRVVAVYSGDGRNASSRVSTAEIEVDRTTVTTTLAVSRVATSGYGAPIHVLTATVTGELIAGQWVTFFRGDEVIGEAWVVDGRATLIVTDLPPGAQVFRAQYAWEPASAEVAQVVPGVATTTQVLSASSIPCNGAVSVRVNGKSPAGTVTFFETVLGETRLLGSAPVVDGVATLAGALLTAGAGRELSAAYEGDENNAPSLIRFTRDVTAVATTTTLVAPPTSSVSASAPLVLTARVTGVNPTGTVTFYNAGVALGTVAVRNGLAALTVNTLTAGSRSLTAAYSGDAVNAASTSSAVTERILGAPPTVTLTGLPASVAQGAALTLRATVAGVTPSGRVTFITGTTVLGSALLSSGTATLTLSRVTLPVGAAAVQAVYEGDANNAGVISAAANLAVSAGALPITLSRDGGDRTVTNVYDKDGLLRASIDAEGYLTEFTYDSAGRMTQSKAFGQKVPSFGNSVTFETALASARAGDLTALEPTTASPDDATTTFTYDARGHKITEVDAEGYRTEFAYDAVGRLTTTTRYEYGLTGAAVETQVTTTSWDGLGRVRDERNAEQTVTRYQYDLVGNLVSKTLAYGDAVDQRAYQTQYDVQGRVTRELSAAGAAALAALPAGQDPAPVWNQYAVTHGYDAAGRRISTTDAIGRKTFFFHDEAGRLIITVNAEGQVAESTYDALGRLTRTTQHLRLVNTTGFVGGVITSAANAAARAAMAAAANASGDAPTSYEYDARGLLTARTDALGGQYTAKYDAFGGVIESTQTTDPNHRAETIRKSTYTYDRRGLQMTVVDDAGGVNAQRKLEYDAFGRITNEWDANGRMTETDHDRLGRVVQTWDPLRSGTGTRTDYDAFGRVLRVTDALGSVTRYAYDTLQRRVTVTTPESVETTAVHDRHGEAQSEVDGNKVTTTYQYDRDGNLRYVRRNGVVVKHDEYDRVGRLVDSLDANGEANGLGVHLEYDPSIDPLGRVTSRTLALAGQPSLVTTYRYLDAERKVRTTDPRGIVTEVAFDKKGQTLTQTIDAGGLNLLTTYTYDDEGRTLTVRSPGGTVTRHEYDSLGRRRKTIVDDGGLSLTQTFEFDAAGNMVASRDANGNLTRYVYDADNRLVFTVDAAGGVKRTVYDALGRVTASASYARAISLAGLSDRMLTGSDVTTRLRAADVTHPNAVEYRVYDKDSRLRYTLDGTGSLTWYRYDGHGNVVEKLGYANKVSLGGWSASTPETPPAVLETLRTWNRVAAADAPPSTEVPAIDPAHDLRVQTIYDAFDRATHTLDGTGAVVKQAYDANGNVTHRWAYGQKVSPATAMTAFDIEAALAAAAASSPVPPVVSHVRNGYDAANRLVWTVDGVGAVTRLFYDEDGNQIVRETFATRIAETDDPTDVTRCPILGTERVTVQAYDRANRLVRTVDALGSVTDVEYDANGNVWKTTAWANRLRRADGTTIVPGAVTSSAAAQALLAAIQPPTTPVASAAGDRVSWSSYDAANRLRYAIDATGAVTENVYDAAGSVTAATRYATRIASPEFDANKRLTSLPVADPFLDRTTKNAYDVAGRLVYTVDPQGYVKRYETDRQGRIIVRTAYGNAVFGLSGQPTVDEIAAAVRPNADVDRIEKYDHDAAGRLVAMSDALGFIERYVYDGLGNRIRFTNKKGATWDYEYDGAGRLLAETTPQVEVFSASVTPVSSSTAGTGTYGEVATLRRIVTRNTYDALGNLTKRVEDADGSSSRETSYRYDAVGHQVRTDFPSFNVYQDEGAALGTGSITDRHEVTKSLSSEVTYDALGNAVCNRDVVGKYTFKVYDAQGRVKFEIDAAGYVTGYEHDVFGGVTKLTRYARAIPAATLVTWGPANLPTVTGVAAAISGSASRTVETTYDRLGRTDTVLQPESWVNDGTSSAGYRARAVTRNVYNAFGEVAETRVLASATGDGTWAVTDHRYDRCGNEVLTVDAAGFVTRRSFDAAGNVTWVIEHACALLERTDDNLIALMRGDTYLLGLGGDTGGYMPTDRATHYEYDLENNKTAEIKGARQLDDLTGRWVGGAEYSVDSKGTALLGPLATTYGYDAVGNLTRTTDAVANLEPEYALARSTFTYYDVLGRTVAVVAPVRASTTSGTNLRPYTFYRRDGFGNVVAEVASSSSFGRTTEQGKTENSTTRSGEGTVGVRAPNSTDKVKISRFDVRGNVVEVRQSKDMAGQYPVWIDQYTAYDEFGRVAKEWRPVTVNGAQAQLFRVVKYDALGNQVAVLTPGTSHQVNGFTIDARAAGIYTTAMKYNAYGELEGRSTVGQLVDPATVTSFDEVFEYDEAGRLWRTNAQDGIWKVTLRDLLGNETVSVVSAGATETSAVGVDLRSLASAEAADQAGHTGLRRTETTRRGMGMTVTEDGLRTVVTTTLPYRKDLTDAQRYRPVVQRELDRWGNVLRQSDPAEQPTTFTRYEYNVFNKVTRQDQVDGRGYENPDPYWGWGVAEGPVTQIYYDAVGRQVAVRDANGHVNGQEYDSAGQLVREIHADGGVVRHAYDVFGNEVRLTDAENNVTDYGYDWLGNNRTIRSAPVKVFTANSAWQVQPSAVDANGDPALRSLLTQSVYDELGRKISETNAANQTTRYTYDLRGNLVVTATPDRTTVDAFDVHDRKVGELDANGYISTWQYDAFGRATGHRALSKAGFGQSGATTSYEYDNAGQLTHEKSTPAYVGLQGVPSKLKDRYYAYDEAGQLTSIHDVGLASQDVNVSTWHDQWTRFAYDAAGRKVFEFMAENGITYQNQRLGYDTLGRLAQVDAMDGVSIHYEYDKVGNRTHQRTSYTTQERRSVDDIIDVVTPNPNAGYPDIHTPTKIGSHIVYDATAHSEELWFAYDAMNRQVLVDGAKNDDPNDLANITSKQGHVLTYDRNGNRTSDKSFARRVYSEWVSEHYDENGTKVPSTYIHNKRDGVFTEYYEYDALNRLEYVSAAAFDKDLKEIPDNRFYLEERLYDGASRLVKLGAISTLDEHYVDALMGDDPNASGLYTRINRYAANGRLEAQRTYKFDGEEAGGEFQSELTYTKYTQTGYVEGHWETTTTYPPTTSWVPDTATFDQGVNGYDAVGNVTGYMVRERSGVRKYFNTDVIVGETYQEGAIKATRSDDPRPISGWAKTTQSYDGNGFLTGLKDSNKSSLNRTFVNDAAGHVLQKTQQDRVLRELLVDGKVVGIYGEGVDPDDPWTDEGNPRYVTQGEFDQTYKPITNSYPSAGSGQYAVAAGDTLRTIAQAAYGDGALWYLIADANGLRGDADLRVGQTLNIPQQVAGVHNNAGTFKLYDSSRIVGDTSPYLPAPKAEDGCGIVKQVILTVISIVVQAVLQYYGVPAPVAAALGSFASQMFAIGVGWQQDLDWKAMAIAAAAAWASKGVDRVLKGASDGSKVAQGIANGTAKGLTAAEKVSVYAGLAVKGVATNALTQGVSVAVGLQDKFEWASVASAGATAGFGAALNDAMGYTPGGPPSVKGFASSFGSSAIGGVVQQVARGGAFHGEQVFADAFGNALGTTLAEAAVDGLAERDVNSIEALEQVKDPALRARLREAYKDARKKGASVADLERDAGQYIQAQAIAGSHDSARAYAERQAQLEARQLEENQRAILDEQVAISDEIGAQQQKIEEERQALVRAAKEADARRVAAQRREESKRARDDAGRTSDKLPKWTASRESAPVEHPPGSTPGINCGVSCSVHFTPGTTVKMVAPPDSGPTFQGFDADGKPVLVDPAKKSSLKDMVLDELGKGTKLSWGRTVQVYASPPVFVTVEGSGKVFRCDNNGQLQVWFQADLDVEVFGRVGYAWDDREKFKDTRGQARRKMVPDWWDKDKQVRRKANDGMVKRPHDWFSDGLEASTEGIRTSTEPKVDACPKEGFSGQVRLFIRGEAGLGLGVQAFGEASLSFDGDFGAQLQAGLNPAVGVWGAQLDVGGGGTGTYRGPLPDPIVRQFDTMLK